MHGIIVEQNTIVVDYVFPIHHMHRADLETYLHRISRTRKFGKSGLAINFDGKSRIGTMLQQISENFGKPINPFTGLQNC